MVVGHVVKENALMIMTFDEEQADELCADLYEILQAAYFVSSNRISMFGNPWFEIELED